MYAQKSVRENQILDTIRDKGIQEIKEGMDAPRPYCLLVQQLVDSGY